MNQLSSPTSAASQVFSLEALKALTFDDFPADSEIAGMGVHQGKRFRVLECSARNDQGDEHRYTLRWTRYSSPVQTLTEKLHSAQKALTALQEKDTDKVRDSSKYCDQLSKANDKVSKLSGELRLAKQEGKEAPADKLKVVDHGPTPEQIAKNRIAEQASNKSRPSAAFIRHILRDTGVDPNETQWEIIADYLEGKCAHEPFFFMGPKWIPVIEKAGAITEDRHGKPHADGEQMRATYQAFIQQELDAVSA